MRRIKKDSIYDVHCISRYLYQCFSNNPFLRERRGWGGVSVAHLEEVDSSVLGVVLEVVSSNPARVKIFFTDKFDLLHKFKICSSMNHYININSC